MQQISHPSWSDTPKVFDLICGQLTELSPGLFDPDGFLELSSKIMYVTGDDS